MREANVLFFISLNIDYTVDIVISLCIIIVTPFVGIKLEEFNNFVEPNSNEGCEICKPLHDFPSLVSPGY